MGSAPKEVKDEGTDDDFRRAVADAQPLDAPRKVVHQRRPAPVPRQRIRDERAVLDESLGPVSLDDALDSGTELTYLADGLRRDVLRKLRRGHWVVEDELDLHGMNRQVAALAVSQFLNGCKKRHVRCVRIVHGKGRGSHNREPVLKGLLRKWLLREEVLAFSQAPAPQGGAGAVLVLLKG
jgi:DNA-nicking Smr family endonuclease